jgi:hypothetical protein
MHEQDVLLSKTNTIDCQHLPFSLQKSGKIEVKITFYKKMMTDYKETITNKSLSIVSFF